MAKILISGQWMWRQYQELCALALEKLGHEVVRFGWYRYFYDTSAGEEPKMRSFSARLQNKYIAGPILRTLNHELLQLAAKTKPDVVWLYNDTHIFPRTISHMRKLLPNARFAQYANDNPWGKNFHAFTWRHFRKSIPLFDINFCYRNSNIADFKLAGAGDVRVLRSYYSPEETFPVDIDQIEQKFRSDIVFAGHYEDDGRLGLLSRILRSGFDLKLFGTGWDAPITGLPPDDPLRKLLPIKPVRGAEYRQAICGSKISLAFLSKLNEDTYTRRSFEIPAMKSFMLSEYTEDLDSLFKDGVDAEYFRNADELLSKIGYYLENEKKREQIASSGYARVKRDGHDVESRMKQFMKAVLPEKN